MADTKTIIEQAYSAFNRDWIGNRQVARNGGRTCLFEWSYPGAGGCSDGRDPVVCNSVESGWRCCGFEFIRRRRGDYATASGGRVGEQCGHLRAKAVYRNSRCGLVSILRNQRHERNTTFAELPRGFLRSEVKVAGIFERDKRMLTKRHVLLGASEPILPKPELPTRRQDEEDTTRNRRPTCTFCPLVLRSRFL
jgi:hypothetical protein